MLLNNLYFKNLMSEEINNLKEKEKEKDNETSSILNKTQASTINKSNNLTSSSNSIDIDDIEKNIIEDKPIKLQNPNKINKSTKTYKFGHTWAFWYKDGEPRIIIGPHCIIINKIYIFNIIILILLFTINYYNRAILCMSYISDYYIVLFIFLFLME